MLMWADDLEEAAIQLDIASAAADSPHFALSHRLMAQVMAVNVDYRRGHWSKASGAAAELLNIIDDFDQHWLAARANSIAALPLAAQGNWDVARAHIEAAIATEDGASFVEVINARTALAFAQDDPETMRSVVSPLHDALPIFEHFEPTQFGFWPLYAHALVRLGDLEEAESVLAPFERLAQTRERRSALASAARVRGCLEAARRDAGAARSAFEASLRFHQGSGMPFEEALTRLEFGRHLRRVGQRRAAVRQLSAARQTLVQLGAVPFLQVVDNELGAEPSQSPNAQVAPLTPRQRMVAEAVMAGKSNREIANEFYVSIKTVEFHINQILTRLGVDSRAEIGPALRSV